MNILIKDIFKQNWNNDFIFSPKENITYSYGDFFLNHYHTITISKKIMLADKIKLPLY